MSSGLLPFRGWAATVVSWQEIAADAGQDDLLRCEADFEGDGPTFPFGAYVAVVTVDAGTGSVHLDRMVTVDLRTAFGSDASGPIAVVPVTGAVWATRSLSATGAHGPLVTSLAAMPLPHPLRLPHIVEDLRVAVR